MNVRAMLVALVAALVGATSVVSADSPSDPTSARVDNVRHRSLPAIDDDLHEALRAEALSRRQGPNTSEVIRLVELYREMAAHPKRDSSRVLARMGLRLRSRLEIVRDHVKRHAARQDRNKKMNAGPGDLAVPDNRVLAQQVAAAGGAGPGAGGQGAAVRGGGTIDYGPELVELIQATISPATWDINGGRGSIVYFSPLRVIVVSAPGEVHGEVADVLGQLRAAP